MEIAASDKTLGSEKLVQSVDNERITDTYSEQELVAVDTNYTHSIPESTSQIPPNDINSCTPHYMPESISSENNLNNTAETESIGVQHFYSYEQQKAPDPYIVESELSVVEQTESEEKVAVNEYVIENVVENIYANEQENSVEENEPSTEQYTVSENDNFESQYESEALRDSHTVVEESYTQSQKKIDDNSLESENVTGNENVIENPIENIKDPLNETDLKKEDSVGDIIQEQVIETIHDASEPSSLVDDTTEIQTSNEAEESLVDRQDGIEMTSSRIVQGEDGTILTVETYRTADTAKDPKQSTKTVVEVAPPKQRRTRKPPFDVPMHVLGIDISKPNESVPNGRPSPKPRLGVKVPYRNLTSQIVSKAEIEEEIMERSRQKQEQQKVNVHFARSLTHRLAKRIAPAVETETISNPMTIENEEAIVDDPSEINQSDEALMSTESNTIENDSDLLAILEGDGEDMPVLPKEVITAQEDDTNLKALEREIALQQLQELPNQEPKPRIFRSRQFKTPPSETTAKIKSTVLEKTQKSPPERLSDKNKENSSKQSTSQTHSTPEKKDPYNIDSAVSPKKVPVEVEPQVKVNMVLKTYSRKRRISDSKDSLSNSPPKKPTFEDPDIKVENEVPTQPEVYITKSSRVIKRKVIWDPAEAQPRTSTKTTTKSTDVKISPIVKQMKVEKAVNQEKPIEKKVDKPTVKKEKISPEKKIKSEPPKTNKSPPKGKKPRSEIDRLLMDEGAVKMLYELNNEPLNKKKKDFYSVDRAEREILKKANQLKNELQQQNAEVINQKSLRKKEGFTPSPVKPAITLERKMSKDSTLSSVQNTPPGSPFQHSQSSMLIRRRSSSSLSSSDSNFDDDDDDDDDDDEYLIAKTAKRKTEGSKSKKKKSLESTKQEIKDKSENIESPLKISKTNQFKSFSVKSIGKNICIELNYVDDKCYFTTQVLEELTVALKRFAKDKECVSVSLASGNTAFCLGLDYISLVNENEDERNEEAKHMTDKVRDFLMCLLHFPKILIACIQGDCAGLGVTMLPLFDMVIASDKATFSTPYSKLGCMSEAGFLLSFPNFINHGLAAELLYAGQTLTADDAFRRGLVTRLCWPEKYKETLKSIVTSISQGSKQSLESMKKQLRNYSIKQTEAAINTDMKTLIDHWTSAECQNNFLKLENFH